MKRLIIFLLIQCTISICQETGARYLIITPDDYYNALIPLAEWKTQKGYKAKIVTLSDIGSSNQNDIRNYIVNAYNTWQVKPEYLLLVGSDDQLPFPSILYMGYWLQTDNFYTDVTGDFHNEIIPGRIWADSVNNVETVVAKVLGYERDPYLDDSTWFKKGVTIVNENEGGQPPSDSLYWEDARYAYNLMLNAGYVHIDSLSYNLGDDSSDVIDVINDGRTYILYRGIGFGVWEWPFMNIPPWLMTNGLKLPIVVSATCATIDGIGWWWLNAGTPEEPKGIVGFLGTTTALMEAAELRSALTQGTFESLYCDSFTTLGKATEAGRLNYYAEFGDELEYYSWTCLGDPEMTVWTTTPRVIQVSHTTELYTGLCSVSVNVQYNSIPVESALVCVMAKKDSSFYNYGRTDNTGNIEFIDTLHISGDSVIITATGRNLKPYYDAVGVHFGGGPYVLLSSFSISDSAGGNNDSIANPGEDIEIPLWIMNWGDSIAYDVFGVIPEIVTDRYLTVYDTIKDFGDIQPLDSAYTSDNGYNVIIAPNCSDSHKVHLQLIIRDVMDATWTSHLSFTVHAPIILFNEYYFPGYLKYTPVGDTNQLIIELENTGSYKAENVTGKIFSDDSLIFIIDSSATFGTIFPGGTSSNQSNPFIIATDPETPLCSPVDIKLAIASGVYNDTLDFTIYIGQKDYLIWDPDLNQSSGPIIKAKLDALDFYGDYTTNLPYGFLSLYKSLYICAGVIGNSYVIKDTSRASQDIEEYLISLGGKVYLEGGNVWYGDPHYNHGYDFCPLFDIQPVGYNIGLFQEVTGMSNTFTQDMLFGYQGDATLLDHIDSTDGSFVIFRSTYNDKGCGVAANNRTVGLSFELGGLVDGILPSTKLVLVDSIMKYFGIPPTGAEEIQLFQYPNMPSLAVYPTLFRNRINIRYNIGQSAKHAELKIYDVTGRLIRDFSLPTAYSLLPTTVTWDGTDGIGRRVPEGIYFVCFSTENYRKTEKIILLR